MIIHEEELYSRKEMETLQLMRLKETVEKVYNKVPFYQNQFKERNINTRENSIARRFEKTSVHEEKRS